MPRRHARRLRQQRDGADRDRGARPGRCRDRDPAEAVAGADLVIICTPVGSYAALGAVIAPHLAPGAIVTDVGSVKQSVIRDLAPVIPAKAHLIPGHPIAGTEKSGPLNGFGELFEGRWAVLTPPPGTDRIAIDKVSALWHAIGSDVVEMDAQHHDKVLASPHICRI